MARVRIKQFLIDPLGGEIEVRLTASRTLPMEGVMSCIGRGHVEPAMRTDPTTVSWRLPAEEYRYVFYGIVTPIQNLWRAPFYERRVLQGGLDVKPKRDRNPFKQRTRKYNVGEWIGLPEVISVKLK